MRFLTANVGASNCKNNKAYEVFHDPLMIENILLWIEPIHTARCMTVSASFCRSIRQSERLQRRLFLPPGRDEKKWWVVDSTTERLLQTKDERRPLLKNARIQWPFLANSFLFRDIPKGIFQPFERSGSHDATLSLRLTPQQILALDPLSSLWSMSLCQPPAYDVTVVWDGWGKDDHLEFEPFEYYTRIHNQTPTGDEIVATLGDLIRGIQRYGPSRFLITSVIIHGGVCVTPSLLRQVRATGRLTTPPLSLLLNSGSQRCAEVLRSRRNARRVDDQLLDDTTSSSILNVEKTILSYLTTKDFTTMVQVSKTFGSRMLEFPYTAFRPGSVSLPQTDFWILRPGVGIVTRVVCDAEHTAETAFVALHQSDFECEFNRVLGFCGEPAMIKRVVTLNENVVEEVDKDTFSLQRAEKCLQARLIGPLLDRSDSRGPMSLTMPPSPVEVETAGRWVSLHTIHKSGAVYDDIRFKRDVVSSTPNIRFRGIITPSPRNLTAAAAAPLISIGELYTKFYPYQKDGVTPKHQSLRGVKQPQKSHPMLYRPPAVKMSLLSSGQKDGHGDNRVFLADGYQDLGISPLNGYPGYFESKPYVEPERWYRRIMGCCSS